MNALMGGLLRTGTYTDFTFTCILFVSLLVKNETQHQRIDFIDSIRPLFSRALVLKFNFSLYKQGLRSQ